MVERVVPVEKEDWLKAGHCVEPFNGMQFCAIVVGAHESTMTNTVVFLTAAVLFLFVMLPLV